MITEPLNTPLTILSVKTTSKVQQCTFRSRTGFCHWTLEVADSSTKKSTSSNLISVREDGVWIADLDILGIEEENLSIMTAKQLCPGHDETALVVDYTSIDSWGELLDGPISVGILRARGNWAARLAAVSILCQQGKGHAVGLLDRKGFCLKCLEASITVPRDEFRRFESGLPSFCID
jgi:hypothetical protein